MSTLLPNHITYNLMSDIDIIIKLSSIFWIIVFLRQRKGEYNLYFLVLAMGDPVADTLIHLHYTEMLSFFMITLSQSDPIIFYLISFIGSDTDYIMIILTIFSYFSVTKLTYLPKSKILGFSMFLLLALGFYLPTIKALCIACMHFSIMLLLFYRIITMAKQLNKISAFDFALIFFEVSVIAGFIGYLADDTFIMNFFIGMIIFRMLIAIYFIVVRFDSKYAFISLPDYSAGRT